MNRNKALRLLPAFLLVLALTACGGNEAPGNSDGTYVKPVESQPRTTAAPVTTEPGSTTSEAAAAPVSTEAVTEAPTVPAPASTVEVIASGLAPGQTTAGAEAPAGAGSFDEGDLFFTYKGKSIRAGEAFSFADFEADWGVPQIEKAQACLGGGFDENYYFGDSLMVFTLGDTGEQLIYDITVMEEGYTTAKGAVIGQTTREELKRIYGEPASSMGTADRYEAGDTMVSFIFAGGILSEIDYNNTQN